MRFNDGKTVWSGVVCLYDRFRARSLNRERKKRDNFFVCFEKGATLLVWIAIIVQRPHVLHLNESKRVKIRRLTFKLYFVNKMRIINMFVIFFFLLQFDALKSHQSKDNKRFRQWLWLDFMNYSLSFYFCSGQTGKVGR